KQYLQELDQQFKDFGDKVLKIKDFNIIDLAFNILFNLANLKSKIFLFIEKVNNFDLEGSFLNEIDSLIGEIDKYLKSLPEWNSTCIKITNQFKDLNNFIENIKDSLFYFEIQEKLLIKMDEIKNKLLDKSKNIDEYELKKKSSFRSKHYKKKIEDYNDAIYSDFLLIIGLKLVYNLIVELE
ncbi:7817_t:CDS:2, partial [Cetraspora pellucida]